MRPITTLLAVALLAGAASTLPAQGTLRPAPSTRATAQVELTYPRGQGPADAKPAYIRVDYGQPHLRGRRINTDSLVPYDQVWRTGANAPTTLTTDVDLILGGQAVPKGTWVVWTLPSRAGWKLLLTRPQPPEAGQENRYAAANEVARVDLKAETAAAPVESFTIWLVPSTQPGAARGELRLAWGTTMLSTEWAVR